MDKEKIKEYFKPTFAKISIAIVLFLILTYLLIYSSVTYTCIDICKNDLLDKLGIILNIIPFLLLKYFGRLIDDILLLLVVLQILWAYFLSCTIIFAYNKYKTK